MLQDSVILSALFHIFEKTRFLLTHGLFAKVFTAYSEEERLLETGLFSSNLSRKKKRRELAVSIKRRVASLFETSLIMKWLDRWSAAMLYWQMRTYGAFLLSLGVSGTLVYVFREFILEDTVAFSGNWFFPLGAILLSVPFLACEETLATAILESWILPTVLFRYFGLSRESFLHERKEPKLYGVASALGIALGVLTYFISPAYYLLFFCIFLLMVLVFCAPEIGVLLLVLAVSFIHYTGHATLVLVSCVLAVDLACFVKWIRGKRMLTFRLIDRAVAVLAGVFLLNGLVSVGGIESLRTAILYTVFLSAYFVVVNFLRSHAWIKKTWLTLLFSGLFSCAFGIYEIFTGSVNASWVDMKLFSQTVRITGGFENPNVYAEYLLFLTPLAFVFLLEGRAARSRLLAFVPLGIYALCIVNTWSRGAWLGLLVAFVLFLLITDKRSPVYLLGAALVTPMATVWLPSSILSRFLSIGDLGDSSVSYRFSVWRGVWRMLRETAWFGTGVGYSAFSALYPAFAYGGSAGVRHAHSFYLQIIVEFGIVGFFIVAAVLFLFFQMCLEYLLTVEDRSGKRLVAMVVSSVFGLLIMGLTDHIWYDHRIFFCFWVIIALASAQVRIGYAENERRMLSYENNAEQASIILGENALKRGRKSG